MSARCQVLGTTPGFGHTVSHSHVRTKRRFDPNVQRKRYWVPSLGRGIEAVVAEILAPGDKI